MAQKCRVVLTWRVGGGGIQPLDLAADFKTPGADLGNVLYLRNIADADKLIDAFKELKEKKEKGKVVIQGLIQLFRLLVFREILPFPLHACLHIALLVRAGEGKPVGTSDVFHSDANRRVTFVGGGNMALGVAEGRS